MNIAISNPQTQWPPRICAIALAVALHGLVWLAWHNRPVVTAPRLERTVEVALISQPKAEPAPAPQPPRPPEPPKPKEKPKPTPKPLPAKQAAPAPKTEAAEPPPAAAPSAPAEAPPRFQEANYKAAYLQNPPPRYPPMARERHWQGEVLIRATVLADGTAGAVRLERGSGHDSLDEAALDAVKNWRFVAAKEGDKAVESTVIIPIEFKLKN